MRRDIKVYLKLATYTAGFVTLSVIFATIWNTDRSLSRAPASDEFDEDGQIVFSNETIRDLEGERRKSFGGTHAPLRRSGRVFTAVKNLTGSETTQISGVKALRGDRVRFDVQEFTQTLKTQARKVELDLFDDFKLVAELSAPSSYAQNQGIYTGGISGDPSGQVRLFVEGSHISGVIEARGHIFRIIDAGDGTQIIIEEDNTRL
jgi:hypothetical protein